MPRRIASGPGSHRELPRHPHLIVFAFAGGIHHETHIHVAPGYERQRENVLLARSEAGRSTEHFKGRTDPGRLTDHILQSLSARETRDGQVVLMRTLAANTEPPRS